MSWTQEHGEPISSVTQDETCDDWMSERCRLPSEITHELERTAWMETMLENGFADSRSDSGLNYQPSSQSLSMEIVRRVREFTDSPRVANNFQESDIESASMNLRKHSTITQAKIVVRYEPRVIKTRKQVQKLEAAFRKGPALDKKKCLGLTKSTGLSETRIRRWFEYRRRKA